MKVVVVGAGAIGAYIGAALVRSGTDVVLVARGPHLRAMQERGVRVLTPLGDFTAHPPATDDLQAVTDADAVFVALKSYSLPALAPRLGPLLPAGVVSIWAQNGFPWWYFHSYAGPLAGQALESVDPKGIVARSVPAADAVGCVIYCSTEIIEPGVIRHVEGTRFDIGELDGSKSPRCKVISEAFAAAGLKAPVDRNIREKVWLKLVGNAAFNPVTALTGATLHQLGELPDVVEVLRSIMEECIAVAKCLDIDFPVSVERRLQAGLAVGDHKTSMLQDLEHHKPLELDCMTGAVVELADLLGVDVPYTRAIHATTRLLDRVSRPA